MVSIARDFQSTFEEQINFENQWRLTGQGTLLCCFAGSKNLTNDEAQANSIVVSKTIDIIPAGRSYLGMWIICIATTPD